MYQIKQRDYHLSVSQAKTWNHSEFNYRMIINLIKIGDILCYYQNEIVRSIIRSTFQAACLTINEKVNRISDIIQEKPFFPLIINNLK